MPLADTSLRFTLLAALLTMMFLAHTVTVKEQLFVPAKFVAVHVTMVAPMLNGLPDDGTQVTTGAGFPVAVGFAQVTAIVPAPLAIFAVMLPGHVRVGAIP